MSELERISAALMAECGSPSCQFGRGRAAGVLAWMQDERARLVTLHQDTLERLVEAKAKLHEQDDQIEDLSFQLSLVKEQIKVLQQASVSRETVTAHPTAQVTHERPLRAGARSGKRAHQGHSRR